MFGPMPVFGRPIFFFSRSAIALPSTLGNLKGEPGQGGCLAPVLTNNALPEGGEGWLLPTLMCRAALW